MLFKEFAGVDAFPLCMDTTDVDEIVGFVTAARADVRRHQPRGHRRAALLRDRAPAARELDIPVFHDDQHGTAIVVARRAAQRAARGRQARRGRARRDHRRRRGRDGVHEHHPRPRRRASVIVCDIDGALYRGAAGPRPDARELAERTNPRREQGTADELLAGADVYLGLSGPGAVSPAAVRTMARERSSSPWPIPTPEVQPEDVADHVRDHGHRPLGLPQPDQQRARLPGRLPRCARRARHDDQRGDEARRRAGDRLVVADDELDAEYIIPSAFNRDVAPAVAEHVAEAAERTGVARRHGPVSSEGTTVPSHSPA